MNCSEIPTLLSTSRRSNIFCAPRRNAALAIYFYAVISTSSGHRWSPAPTIYMFFMRRYLHHLDVTERHFFFRSPGVARALKFCFVFCFCFVSFSRSFLNKEATLLIIPSLLRRIDTLVPRSSGANVEYI